MPIVRASSRRYAEGAIGAWAARQSAEGLGAVSGPVMVQNRMWFNEANDSHYFLVPGLVVLVMTLISAFLTAMVVAREWERGTFEALFVTPVRSEEILLGKTIPYFGMGMVGTAACACWRRSFCSTCRSAARSPCCSVPRCCTYGGDSASGC